ncbi:UNVERIFIED_CONTAM: hypothetical protein RMT77_014960 [Armadillidium vulgare]
MLQIIISILMVRHISVDGCSIPSKYFEKETSANTIQGPITDTTEEPSITTSQNQQKIPQKNNHQTPLINHLPLMKYQQLITMKNR